MNRFKLFISIIALFYCYLGHGQNVPKISPDNKMTSERIVRFSNDTIFVDVLIKRQSSYESFGIIYEHKPKELQWVVIDSSNAVTIKEEKDNLKFIFMDIPKAPGTKVSYALIFKSRKDLVGAKLTGELRYIHGNYKRATPTKGDIDDLDEFLKL